MYSGGGRNSISFVCRLQTSQQQVVRKAVGKSCFGSDQQTQNIQMYICICSGRSHMLHKI